MFKKVLEYAGEYRKTTYASMAVMLIGIVMNVLPFLFLYQLMDPLLFHENVKVWYVAWRVLAIGICGVLYALFYVKGLALSHRARLLILDEPTSGLDPVARDDLLELFHQLVREGERAILFSTHITSDLEKCADQLTYLKKGRVLASGEMRAVLQRFQMLRRPGETGPLTLEEIMVRTEREVS